MKNFDVYLYLYFPEQVKCYKWDDKLEEHIEKQDKQIYIYESTDFWWTIGFIGHSDQGQVLVIMFLKTLYIVTYTYKDCLFCICINVQVALDRNLDINLPANQKKKSSATNLKKSFKAINTYPHLRHTNSACIMPVKF